MWMIINVKWLPMFSNANAHATQKGLKEQKLVDLLH